jgi:hypothetical protein
MMMHNNQNALFREVQRFRAVWIWCIVLLISGMMWVAAVQQIGFQKSFGENPMTDSMLWVFWLLFGIGLPVLFLFCNLTSEVREDGLYIRFTPFHRSFHKIGFDDLEQFKAVIYRPIKDYGGWGIRYGSKGKAYNVSGSRGVLLTMKNGKRLLLGSQRPDELCQWIQMQANRS